MHIVRSVSLACLAAAGITACAAASSANLLAPSISTTAADSALNQPTVVEKNQWQDISVKAVADGAQMLANQDGTLLYVTDNGGNALVVVDAQTHSIVKTITGQNPEDLTDGCPHNFCRGAGAAGVALSPTGDVAYVTSMKPDRLSKIDLHSGTIIADVKVGRFPRDLVVSPDGRRAYVMNSVDNTISVVDLRTMTTIGAPVQLAGGNAAGLPFGRYLSLWLSADSDRLFVNNAISGLVDVFDAHSLQQAGAYKLNFGVNTAAATREAARVAIADDLGLSILDSNTMGLQARLSFTCGRAQRFGGVNLDSPTMAWSRDGRYLAVHPAQQWTVWVLDTIESAVVRQFPLEDGAAYSLLFSPSGDMLYILDGSGNVHFVGMDKTLPLPTGEDDLTFFCNLIQYFPGGEASPAAQAHALPPPPLPR